MGADVASKQTLEHWNESSIHPPESSNLGLTSYQPTLDASGNYVNDVVTYCTFLCRLNLCYTPHLIKKGQELSLLQ